MAVMLAEKLAENVMLRMSCWQETCVPQSAGATAAGVTAASTAGATAAWTARATAQLAKQGAVSNPPQVAQDAETGYIHQNYE